MYVFQICWNFWSLFLGHFSKHKPLIYEECIPRLTHISTTLVYHYQRDRWWFPFHLAFLRWWLLGLHQLKQQLINTEHPVLPRELGCQSLWLVSCASGSLYTQPQNSLLLYVVGTSLLGKKISTINKNGVSITDWMYYSVKNLIVQMLHTMYF